MDLYLNLFILSLVYIFFDFFLEIHYFRRIFWYMTVSRFFKSRKHILDEIRIIDICLTNDVDIFVTHMNNSRYLRELDFARMDFCQRTELYQTITSRNGKFLQGAATIRYRRFIKPFSIFFITTKIIYWDDVNIFMEHKFIGRDGFVHAIVLGKQRLVNCSAEEIMNILLAKVPSEKVECGGISKVKPEMPIEIQKWNESNEISSAKLRNL